MVFGCPSQLIDELCDLRCLSQCFCAVFLSYEENKNVPTSEVFGRMNQVRTLKALAQDSS